MAAVEMHTLEDRIAGVTLNRPQRLNAIDGALLDGMDAALDAPSLRHAKEIENRTQIISGFTNNPVEAARAHQQKRAPI